MANSTNHPHSSFKDLRNVSNTNMSTSTSDVTVCSCQQSSRRRWKSVPIAANPTSATFLFMLIIPILLNCFACCVSAWPMLNHPRSYGYALPVFQDDDSDVSPWAVASQPVMPELYYEVPDLDQDIDDEEILYEDPEETFQMPGFGSIMDVVPMPEEELELEGLKLEQPYNYERQRVMKGMAEVSPVSKQASSTPSLAPEKSTPLPVQLSTAVPILSDKRKHPAAPLGVSSGQKEFAMLRPPAAKSHHISIDEPEEPKISVAQRSPSNEKPSAYDTLRKYLSLDDALKKEYQQRRANAMSRHAKRESVSSIIAESDNLTGQLNNLKKKID